MKKEIKSEYMTVPEMRQLLGIKKTESYWLYKKGYFKVCETPFGYRIDRKNFEKWYKNQLHYKKVTGEPPGEEIHQWAYLPGELAELLDISECYVYDLLIQEHIETVIVDRRKVIPKTTFHEWYEKQNHFLLPEDRQKYS